VCARDRANILLPTMRCDLCGSSFSGHGALRLHLSKIHETGACGPSDGISREAGEARGSQAQVDNDLDNQGRGYLLQETEEKTVHQRSPQERFPHGLAKTSTLNRWREGGVRVGQTFETTRANQFVRGSRRRSWLMDDQDSLMLRASSKVPPESLPHYLPWLFPALNLEEKVDVVRNAKKVSNSDDFAKLVLGIVGLVHAGITKREEWEELQTRVPELQIDRAVAKDIAFDLEEGPVGEIYRVHRAIRIEVQDIVDEVEKLIKQGFVDPNSVTALAERILFCWRMADDHSNAEDEVFLPALEARAPGTSHCYAAEHSDERKLFFSLNASMNRMQCSADSSECEILMTSIRSMTKTLRDDVMKHLQKEEEHLWPLLSIHFSLEEQVEIVAKIFERRTSIPLKSVESIRWMGSDGGEGIPKRARRAQDHNLHSYYQNFLKAPDLDAKANVILKALRDESTVEFRELAGAIARSIHVGLAKREMWEELMVRVPELRTEGNGVTDVPLDHDEGPVGEIYRVHKAIRIELQDISNAVAEMSDREPPNPRSIAALSERVVFLWRMVEDHSRAEDDIVLPAIEARAPGTSQSYAEEHCDERHLFFSLNKKMTDIQCSADLGECMELMRSVRILLKSLRDDMMSHLQKEEDHLWPLIVKHFSKVEQGEIVAKVFGHMPGERLKELLPWMIRVLSTSEQHRMFHHILEVTKSTMFESWLKSWCPVSLTTKPNPGREEVDQGPRDETDVAVTSLLLLHGKSDIQRAIKAVANDFSLSNQERGKLMQNLMLQPYLQSKPAAVAEAQHNISNQDSDPIYRPGTELLGCEHYQRNCKIVAPCCGRVFVCRLCHDANSDHAIDRFAIKKMLCMLCTTLQPVAQRCRGCNASMARYFCPVCNLFDNDSDRKIYHCHSCNVCRVGLGLGLDFFHCMKCNACVSIQREKSHKCIERVLESECPICRHFLFTSTSPVKYLRCGHLMHRECYDKYISTSMVCPQCHKSLEDMTSYYERLDVLLAREQMPEAYRSIRCRIRCSDCSTLSEVAFHFLYNRCPSCFSYNTRVVSWDPTC